jgi:formate--tetrahydrofolate ligase
MNLEKIENIAKKINITEQYLLPYGLGKAKIEPSIINDYQNKKDGKLILVTAITPTRAGEGKTTTAISLVNGLAKLKKQAILTLREPSLGPVFGLKGGATGGGQATVVPEEDINLHFTGDMHALTSAINLIASIIDNHIFHGNELNIDPKQIIWRRALDMNDRTLRKVKINLSEKEGAVRYEQFMITAASELMAILCLAENQTSFEKMVNQIIVAYNKDNKPVKIEDLRISHAINKLMKEALKPNLVQTNEGNPAFIHGGPFANIAHGCSSLIATKLALKLADYVVTEAGFATELGAEKFMNIKARIGKLHPDCAVIVTTVRALKIHGGVNAENLAISNVDAMLEGCKNLQKHIDNIKKYRVPSVVTINRFATDSEEEIKQLLNWCYKHKQPVAINEAYSKGGEGAIDLALKVIETIETQPSHYQPLYDLNKSIEEKIETIAEQMYGANKVKYSTKAKRQINRYRTLGFDQLPICMAKTPQSLTDNPSILNAPSNFTITIKEVLLSAGAGFIVPLTGEIMVLPGLAKVPNAVKMQDLPW